VKFTGANLEREPAIDKRGEQLEYVLANVPPIGAIIRDRYVHQLGFAIRMYVRRRAFAAVNGGIGYIRVTLRAVRKERTILRSNRVNRPVRARRFVPDGLRMLLVHSAG
jgi:hypothetical protein